MDVNDVDQVEILVHISAPSKGTDDALYRAFATAYLEFEKDSLDKPIDNLQKHPHPLAASREDEQTSFSSIGDVQYLTSFRENAQSDEPFLSGLKSPDASFKSILDNNNSPKFYGQKANQYVSHQKSSVENVDEDSWHSPPSVVPDSQPQMAASLTATSSPATALQMYLDCLSTTLSFSENRLPSTAGVSGDVFPASSTPAYLRRSAGQPQSSLELPSQPRKRQLLDEPAGDQVNSSRTPVPTPAVLPISSIPVSKSIQEVDSSTGLHEPPQKRHRELESERGQLNSSRTPVPTPIVLPISSISVPKSKIDSSTGLHEPAQKRQRRPESDGDQTSSLVRAVESRKNPTAVVLPKKSSIASNATSNPDEIRPPLPQTSLSSMNPSDILTPKLVNLVKDPGMAKSWSEDLATRELRPMERGYWLVNYTTWAPALRIDSWNFLKGYVGRGIAGWGVWCIRTPERSELRLYCWGAIVRHIYFLLHLVSKRVVKRTGATWFDGDGVAIITVPPRPVTLAEGLTVPG